MTRRTRMPHMVLLALLAGLVLFLPGAPASAGTSLATLTATPGSDVKPGESVKFSVEVPYSDPAPEVFVMLEGSVWSTERQAVKFPGVGRPATVQFSKPYPVPPDAKPGTRGGSSSRQQAQARGDRLRRIRPTHRRSP